LNCDLHTGSNATFQIQVGVGAGPFDVRVYLPNPLGTGGYQYRYDNFDVIVEGVAARNIASLTPGALRYENFLTVAGVGARDVNGDGVLGIQFIDRGGENRNWIVSGVELASPGGLPAAVTNLVADQAGAVPGGAALDGAMLAPLVAEAAARWSATGLTAAQAAVLADLHVSVADLGGSILGQAHPVSNDIQLDTDAAGWGWRWEVIGDRSSVIGDRWSVIGDRWSVIGDRWSVIGDGLPITDHRSPITGLDLMHALMHEIGHLLGYEHADEGLMAPVLSASALHPSSFIPHPSSVRDDVFADLGGDADWQDRNEETALALLESKDDGVLAAERVRSSDEAAQARVPRRSRLDRYERELDDWFAELAMEIGER